MNGTQFSGKGVLVNEENKPLVNKVRDVRTGEVYELVMMVGRGGTVTAAVPDYNLNREIHEAHQQTQQEADENARKEHRSRVLPHAPAEALQEGPPLEDVETQVTPEAPEPVAQN